MSAVPHDLRDYLFDELNETERAEVEAYLETSPEAQEELAGLRLTQQALLSVPEEEIPRRIAFVSDKVFEPSRTRRWWNGFWDVAPRFGFSMAAVLLIVFAGIWMVEPTVTVDDAGWRLAFGEAQLAQPTPVPSVALDEDEIGRLVREVAAEQSDRQTEELRAFLEEHLGKETAARRAQFEEFRSLSDESYNILLNRMEQERRATFIQRASLGR
jgi:anti-sigma factor RsiW